MDWKHFTSVRYKDSLFAGFKVLQKAANIVLKPYFFSWKLMIDLDFCIFPSSTS